MDEPAAALTGRNYIGGEWRPATSGATYQRVSPIDLEVVGTFASSAADDVEAAVREARGALQSWIELPSAARAAVLARAADDLDARRERVAADMTTEMGKPSRESRAEVARSAAIFRYAATHAYRAHGEVFAQSSGRPALTFRRPVGVVGLITPWNFPCAIPAWKLAPALAYGNTVVLTLAYDAPLSGLHIAAAFAAAELPPGVLNVVTGRGATVGAAFVREPGVRAISFTGSVATGSALRDEATPLGKRVQLELGGHNPVIVMADADLDRAAEAAYAGAFWSAGQKCTATRRIFVEADVYDAFRLRLLRRIEQARIGDPRVPETEIGLLVNEEQFNEVVRAIERGTAEGGTLLVGGRPTRSFRLPRGSDGVRGRGRRRVPHVRGSLRARHVALSLRRSRRGTQPSKRRRVWALGVDLHNEPRDCPPLHEPDAGGHPPCELADCGRGCPPSVRRHQEQRLRAA